MAEQPDPGRPGQARGQPRDKARETLQDQAKGKAQGRPQARSTSVTRGTTGYPTSPLPSWVHLGPEAQLDHGVLLGYETGRALADKTLRIGAGARIRSGTVIYAGSTIGDGLQTGHHVVLREECRIGRGFQVWNNSTVDYGCVIGDDVKVHTNVYVAQGSVLGDGCFLAPGVVLANDLYPGHARSKELMKGPIVGAGAQLGCNVTVNPFVRIGAGTIVGAGAVVVRDLPEGVVAVGCPARPVKKAAELDDAEVERRRALWEGSR